MGAPMNRRLSATLCAIVTIFYLFPALSSPATTDPVELGRQLLQACEERKFETALTLIKAGAAVNQLDSRGTIPLHCAAFNGRKEIIQLLLENGTTVNQPDNRGHTPLYWAVRNDWAAGSDHEAIVRLLLENGATANHPTNDGETPLRWAAINGHEAVVQLLLEHGATANQPDKRDKTPLYWAALNGREAVVQTLLMRGAQLPTSKQLKMWSSDAQHLIKKYAHLIEERTKAIRQWHEKVEQQYQLPREITRFIWEMSELPEEHKPKKPAYHQKTMQPQLEQ